MGAAGLDERLTALPGTIVAERYRIDGLLGTGGMGAVFRAHHLGLARDVAVKVLHPDLVRDSSQIRRFEREARAAARLDHVNCIRVTDFGTTADGLSYLVMELTAGRDLDALVGQPMSPARAVALGLQILAGLAHAHGVGIVHRDLKPENVRVIEKDGVESVKLLDFGIARIVEGEGAAENLTRTGIVFGTPRYMSPEQAAGGKGDARADLYAVGLILYELLCGYPPFRSDESAMLLRMHILAPPPALPPDVPAALAAVVMRLLEKSPDARYEHAESAMSALRASLSAPASASSSFADVPVRSGSTVIAASSSSPALDPVVPARSAVMPGQSQGSVHAPAAAPSLALPRALTLVGLVVLAIILAAWSAGL